MENKINNKEYRKKIVIKDKNKFYKFIGLFCIFLILIVVINMLSNKKITIDNNTDISKLNINKYSKEVKMYYEGMMEEFIVEYNNIQNIAWTYIYNNVTGDKNIDELIDEVNKVLLSDDWSSIGLEKNTKWRGSYKIDKSTNILMFKFETKDVEPTWIENDNVSYMIEKN